MALLSMIVITLKCCINLMLMLCYQKRFQIILTLASAGGVGAPPPLEYFWNGRRTAWRIALKFCIAYGAFFAQLLAKKLTGSGQVTEPRRHKRNSLRPIFQGNRVFSHVTCCHLQEWRYYARFRSAHDNI